MTSSSRLNYRRLGVAVLIPLIAAGLQWLLWPYIQPFIWFLFYPATFLSAWLNGRWGGVLSTLLSAGLAVYVFAPPMFSFQLDNPATLFSAAVFIIMGGLFSNFFERWRTANQRLDLMAQLQASEASLKQSQAAAHIGHWAWDIRSNRVSWSDEMYRIFGLDPIGFSGDLDEVIRTAIHPDDRQKVAQANTAVSEAGQPAPLEYRVVWPDGTVRTVYAEPAEQTRDEHGRVIRLWGIVQDITERQQAGEALRASQARLNFALEKSHTGGWDLDLIDHTAIRTLEHDRIFGYDTLLPQWTYEMFLEHVLPADRAEVNRLFQAAVAARTDWDFECRIRRVDGEVRWIRASGGYQLGEHDSARRMAGIVQDITQRKQAEQRIQYLTRLYATLSQVNQTIVRVTDRSALFDAICQIAVDYGEFKLAWIGLFEHETGQVTPVAEHGYGENRLPFRDLNLQDEPFRSGLVGRALASGRVEISPDIQLDQNMAHWQAVAARDNYHAAAAIPIRLQGQVVGVLNLYAADVNFFAVEEEQKLLAEMGLDISFALDTMHIEAERQQVEAALRDSEERYRTAQSIGHVGNWEYNLRTTQFWGSDEAKRIYGFDPQQANFSADEVESCILERERVHQALIDLIEAGQPYNLEFEIQPKDSSRPKVISSVAELKEGKHGEPLVVGVIHDVTERKQAEKKLLESEEKYRDLINGMNDTICVIDFDTTILDVNTAATRVLGYTREELLSMKISEIDAALTAEQIQGLAGSMPHDKLQIFETWHRTKDGRRLPVEVSSSLVSYLGRTVIMSIARDITERKEMDAKVRESEEKFRALYEKAPLAYQSLDEAGCFRDVNPAWLQTLGYELTDVIGRPFSQFLHPDYVAHFNRNFPEFKRRGYVHGVEFKLKHKAGHYLDVAYEGCIGYWPDGRFRQTYCVFQDVTQRKQAEAAVLQINAELEKRVAQRTAQLAAANDQLLDLDRLKSKFVSDVSHELRTPVTSLSLYIDLLEHGKPEKREQYVGKLKEQMARLHTLINDILDLSRLERDRDEGGRSPVDINSIVEHVTATQLIAAETAGLVLTCDVGDQLPAVIARPDQLTRAITNVVSNAIKYTPTGSVRVQTRVHDQRVCIAVSDTGRGIPADELPHLFERFYRGHAVAQSTIPGTGLGLSIVKEIIESHGGAVEVQSELGQGSTFFIWLPIA